MSQQFEYLSPAEIYSLRETEKLFIKKQSATAGICVIFFFLIQTLLGFVVGFSPNLSMLFLTDPSLSKLFILICYVASVFLPFLTVYVTMPKHEKDRCYCFDKPISKKSAIAAIGSGMLFCTVGNYITDYLMKLLSLFSIESADVSYTSPDSVDTLILQLINIALLPALLEEFAFRFVVMQPLRCFGDKFAIIMSSVVFSLMHGNIIQIPFALIVGIAIGYLVISTGSIWVGIAIHLFNNAYSVLLTYLVTVNPSLATHFYALINAITIVAGIICFALFMTVCKREKLKQYNGILSFSERSGAYIATVPMIITVIISLVQTVVLLGFTGAE